MCGIYCVYKQSRSCQLPFCASPIFHFEIGDFSVYLYSKGVNVKFCGRVRSYNTNCAETKCRNYWYYRY